MYVNKEESRPMQKAACARGTLRGFKKARMVDVAKLRSNKSIMLGESKLFQIALTSLEQLILENLKSSSNLMQKSLYCIEIGLHGHSGFN